MFEVVIRYSTLVIEAIGVAVILGGIVFATWNLQRTGDERFHRFRRELGLSILLGLEFLVAADIINTVAIEPTMKSVMTLGLIVLIRTFLSFSLQVEIEGKMPWRRS